MTKKIKRVKLPRKTPNLYAIPTSVKVPKRLKRYRR